LSDPVIRDGFLLPRFRVRTDRRSQRGLPNRADCGIIQDRIRIRSDCEEITSEYSFSILPTWAVYHAFVIAFLPSYEGSLTEQFTFEAKDQRVFGLKIRPLFASEPVTLTFAILRNQFVRQRGQAHAEFFAPAFASY
jgi:hypothetical protein